MKIYYLSVIIILIIIVSCNRGTLKFFFDGVDRETNSESGTPGQNSRSELSKDSSTADSNAGINHLDEIISVHPAYLNKQCEKCHDVRHSYRLINRQPDICYTCHKVFESRYPVLHGPVAAGFCTTCHMPHQSKNKKLLVLPVREICQYCHQTGDVNKNQAHQKFSTDNCMTCHNAHGGNTLNLLKK